MITKTERQDLVAANEKIRTTAEPYEKAQRALATETARRDAEVTERESLEAGADADDIAALTRLTQLKQITPLRERKISELSDACTQPYLIHRAARGMRQSLLERIFEGLRDDEKARLRPIVNKEWSTGPDCRFADRLILGARSVLRFHHLTNLDGRPEDELDSLAEQLLKGEFKLTAPPAPPSPPPVSEPPPILVGGELVTFDQLRESHNPKRREEVLAD